MDKPFEEICLDDVGKVLDLTIKSDNYNKRILFLAMLSAFTDDYQINITLNAPSSVGKTYLTNEIAKLFPQEDMMIYSKITPTAFYYSSDAKYDKERKARVLDLERKILIFQEQPNAKVQENLRPILSHDRKECKFSLTNRNKEGAHRAEDVIIKGYPSTVFCSANLLMDEQESTRTIMLSPEINDEKICSAKELIAKQEADPSYYQREIETNTDRNSLKNRIVAIRDLKIKTINLSNSEEVLKRFNEISGKPQARHSRDFKHFINLIKIIAMLNVWYRQDKNGKYYANQQDVNEAISLWKNISRTQCLGLPPYVVDIYYDVILPLFQQKKQIEEMGRRMSYNKEELALSDLGLTTQEITKYHMTTKRSFLDSWKMKNLLNKLEATGLIKTISNPTDKRQKLIIPLEGVENV